MKDIYIFGAGGFAREVFYLIKDLKEYRVKAFVDVVAESPIEVDKQTIEVMPEVEFDRICQRETANVAIAIANNCVVKKIVAKYSRQCFFPNLIHPSVIRFGELKIGQGNIVAVGNFFSEKIVLGSFNRFNVHCGIGHDVTIGDYNQFNPGCKISGAVSIGNENFFGVNSAVLQQINIGNNNVIGASSLIIHNVKDGKRYIGVPAHKFEL